MTAAGLYLSSCGFFLPPSEPKFGSRTIPDQAYTRGLAIDALTLPQANGGAGTIRYRLTPAIPGLRFASGTRVLSGTPSTAGTYRLTYRATDDRDLSATLKFTVTVIGLIGDSPATATVIRPGSPIRGRLEPGTGAHYFKVEMATPARLIAATDRNPRYADTIVGIEGVPGHEPNTSEPIDAVRDVAPGTYHVRVQLDPDGSPSSGEYALAVWVLGPENDTFDIEVRYVGERAPETTTEIVIENAVRRWERIIEENRATSGLIITTSQWKCRDIVPPFGAYIDDLLIYVYLHDLDGPAGRGGPCFSRSAQADGVPGLPFMGTMWFDPKYLSAASLYFTALHEIGHVLGFGTLWDRFGYLQDPAAAAASPDAGHPLQRRTGHRRLRSRRRRWVRGRQGPGGERHHPLPGRRRRALARIGVRRRADDRRRAGQPRHLRTAQQRDRRLPGRPRLCRQLRCRRRFPPAASRIRAA